MSPELERTAVLLVDPYNDFLSDGGKIWPHVKDVADRVDLLAHLRDLVAAARDAALPVVFVPHRRWHPGDWEGWMNLTPYQAMSVKSKTFAAGTWGGEFHPDFQPRDGELVASEHWGSSGFANTDLHLQLTQRGITHVVLIGMIANTCLEATGRFAMELGYRVTLVRDATAAFTDEAMHLAHDISGPTYAHAVTTTQELLARLSTRPAGGVEGGGFEPKTDPVAPGYVRRP